MTLVIDLPEDLMRAVQNEARQRGQSVEDWLLEIARLHFRTSPAASDEVPKSTRRISAVIAEIVSDATQEEIDKLPPDGASQVDHYVYGLPKRSA